MSHIFGAFRLVTTAVAANNISKVAFNSFPSKRAVVISECRSSLQSVVQIFLFRVQHDIINRAHSPGVAVLLFLERENLFDHRLVNSESLVTTQQQVREIFHHSDEATDEWNDIYNAFTSVGVHIDHWVLNQPIVKETDVFFCFFVLSRHNTNVIFNDWICVDHRTVKEWPIVEWTVLEMNCVLSNLVSFDKALLCPEHSALVGYFPLEGASVIIVFSVKKLVHRDDNNLNLICNLQCTIFVCTLNLWLI